MAVHAHPDDESSKGAAMMAAYEDAGAEVMVVTCTGGEAGSLLNPHYEDAVACDRDITAVRRREMAEARDALGVDHEWLGFLDSGLPEGDPTPALPPHSFATLDLQTAALPLVSLIRRFRPHVLISYDEVGGYPHPDHIMAHRITVEAYRAAGLADQYPEAGEAWEVSKLYYDRAFNPEKFQTLHQHYLSSGQDSPLAERVAMFATMEALREARERQAAGEDVPDPEGAPPWYIPRHEVTTQIPVGDHLERRDAALRAHATQVDPHGFFFATPNELLRQTWPWEDYVLIDSRVEVSLPEYDLFQGLR
ncbi:MAG: mycothiol conjugate amidase Mca [Micrococcus sp.]|nr:mycothiol conjugate amidase Mca [Micrococcus sp.]